MSRTPNIAHVPHFDRAFVSGQWTVTCLCRWAGSGPRPSLLLARAEFDVHVEDMRHVRKVTR